MHHDKSREIISTAKVILLDIEGTTTSILFVRNTLFQYAESHIKSYVSTHWEDKQIKDIVISLIDTQDTIKDKTGFVPLSPVPTSASEMEKFRKNVISHIEWQQSLCLKTTALKSLQGLMWKNAYQNKEIVGHVFDDVPEAIRTWKEQGKKVFIYSSGSVDAQKLLFKYSMFGDLDSLIDGNFDSSIGSKDEIESYLKILDLLQVRAEDVVFCTDRPKEVFAAKLAAMKVIRLQRSEHNPYIIQEAEYLGHENAIVESFNMLYKK